jgi:enterochelin esterase family protein
MSKPLLLALTLLSSAASLSLAQGNSGPAPPQPPLTADSREQPGVPTGTLSPKLTHVSRIYDGMTSNYQVYVPAQYDPKTPAALMVFQDGTGYLDRKHSSHPALNVIDNLIAQKKIPVMIAVFVDPGDISGALGTPTYHFAEGFA